MVDVAASIAAGSPWTHVDVETTLDDDDRGDNGGDGAAAARKRRFPESRELCALA